MQYLISREVVGLRLNAADLVTIAAANPTIELEFDDDGSVRRLRCGPPLAPVDDRETIPAPGVLPHWDDPHPELVSESEAPSDAVARELLQAGQVAFPTEEAPSADQIDEPMGWTE